MIVDSSAIMTILLKELEQDRFLQALQADSSRRMSGVSLVELVIASDRRATPIPAGIAEQFVLEAKIAVEPVTLEQVDWARKAHLAYGRGRHAAALNFGDRFTYALAKVTGEPLLFKGADFSLTDIPAVL